MIIKETDKQNLIVKKISSIIMHRRFLKRIILFTVGSMLALGIILASIYYGMVLQKTGTAHFFSSAVRLKSKILVNYIRGLGANPERIDIDIKYKDFQRLAYKRKVALENGILITAPDDYVPAKIRYKDKTINAKIRLKGDIVDQLEGPKWPFRIVIKGQETLFGMKVFSIHTPVERNFFYEYLLHRAMKREGILALRYNFIDVTINGKHKGIYALEEHFEKRLIENNQKREGPIVCFSEDVDIGTLSHFYCENNGDWANKYVDFYKGPVDVYRPTQTFANEELRKQFMLAKDLLEAFQSGKIRPGDVFDCKAFARYFAILDLFNAHHAARYGNLKFYYNPITSKLEPICFDAEIKHTEYICDEIYAEDWYKDYRQITPVLFKDNKLFKLYIKELSRVSESAYLDKLFHEIDDKESKKRLDAIYSEYPHFDFSKNGFYLKQEYIRRFLSLPISINAYFRRYYEEDGKKVVELDVGNIRAVPVRIAKLNLGNGLSFPTQVEEMAIGPSLPERPMNIETVKFILPGDFEWKEEYANDLTVSYALLGLEKLQDAQVIPRSHFNQDVPENDFIRQPSNIQEFDFLSIDEAAYKIYIKQGSWDINKNLIIPKGYKIICNGDTQLNLLNFAKILSYSPFYFIGSEEHPVTIHSKDSTGQGIVVIGAKEKTILRYVIFDNLSNPAQDRWSLTGAVTFYESPVEIAYCRFSNNRSEDALNIVRSDFSIAKALFIKTFSDAFDSDFSRGNITNSSFVDCGNDAIDISGTIAELKNITINGAGDKGLSVGEESIATADDIDIKNANLAAASKDKSVLNLNNTYISNCRMGLAAYQKKPEFGPGSMKTAKLKMDKVATPYLVEEKSELEVNGNKIKPTHNQNDIKKMLY